MQWIRAFSIRPLIDILNFTRFALLFSNKYTTKQQRARILVTSKMISRPHCLFSFSIYLSTSPSTLSRLFSLLLCTYVHIYKCIFFATLRLLLLHHLVRRCCLLLSVSVYFFLTFSLSSPPFCLVIFICLLIYLVSLFASTYNICSFVCYLSLQRQWIHTCDRDTCMRKAYTFQMRLLFSILL